LILSEDALAAALLGSAVELAGHRPHFPEPQEAARDALRRVRPGLVVVESDHADGGTEAFLGPAIMTGARVVLFDAYRQGDPGHRSAEIAAPLALELLHLPDHLDLLLRRIREIPP
jgi:hypothetical protein